MFDLTAEEARVLGALIEKQMTTPEYYPLTLNALTAACNQKSNREPVVDYDETMVDQIVTELVDRGLAGITRSSGGRAVKYLHHVDSMLEIDDEQLALIAVLMLRGPQTPGELRARTDRYVEFASVDAVEDRLRDLITRDVPLVERLEREPGRREHRYRCVLVTVADAVGALDPAPAPPSTPTTWDLEAPAPPSAPTTAELEARVSVLEARITRLESELGL